jgi:hypothetical protein
MKPEAQPAAASSSVHLRTIVICIYNIMYMLSAREKHTGSSQTRQYDTRLLFLSSPLLELEQLPLRIMKITEIH